MTAGRKLCRRCQSVKFKDSFGLDPTYPDGRRRSCNQCVREVRQQWRATHPETRRKARDISIRKQQRWRSATGRRLALEGKTFPDTKFCVYCDKDQDGLLFRIHPTSDDGLADRCKECVATHGRGRSVASIATPLKVGIDCNLELHSTRPPTFTTEGP
jgi:hypothetical protein